MLFSCPNVLLQIIIFLVIQMSDDKCSLAVQMYCYKFTRLQHTCGWANCFLGAACGVGASAFTCASETIRGGAADILFQLLHNIEPDRLMTIELDRLMNFEVLVWLGDAFSFNQGRPPSKDNNRRVCFCLSGSDARCTHEAHSDTIIPSFTVHRDHDEPQATQLENQI